VDKMCLWIVQFIKMQILIWTMSSPKPNPVLAVVRSAYLQIRNLHVIVYSIHY